MPARSWVDFGKIKEAARFEPILERYGIETRQEGRELAALCPFHEERKPSFRVNPEKKVFNCFGCDAKGGILDFVAKKEGVPIKQAAELVAEWLGIDGSPKPTGEKPAKSPPRSPTSSKPPLPATREAPTVEIDRPLAPLTFTLKLSDECEYLQHRIPDPEVRKAFGVGLCSRGLMKDRVCFPIHDSDARLVGYAGRWAGDDPPDGVERWMLPPGFRKNEVVFGLLQVREADHLVVVENPFSVARLASLGIRAAALLGSSISPHQVELVESATTVKRVTLLLDGDDAGRKAATEIAPVLARRFWVRIAELPDSTKPDTVPEETLRSLLAE